MVGFCFNILDFWAVCGGWLPFKWVKYSGFVFFEFLFFVVKKAHLICYGTGTGIVLCFGSGSVIDPYSMAFGIRNTDPDPGSLKTRKKLQIVQKKFYITKKHYKNGRFVFQRNLSFNWLLLASNLGRYYFFQTTIQPLFKIHHFR